MSAAQDAAAARVALERLLADLPDLAAGLPHDFTGAVERYLAALLAANERLNLTRIVDPEPVARLHLLDALAALPLLDDWGGGSAVDLGSGGGLPGIPLALARPAWHWTLVDSVARKADALRSFAADAAGARRVSVIAERAETLGRDPLHRERHDLVAARACASLPVLVELALPLLRVGGRLLAWKGPLAEGDPELERGRTAATELGGGPPAVLPAGMPALGGHTFVVIVKDRPTPSRYPRRPGVPGRRPLG